MKAFTNDHIFHDFIYKKYLIELNPQNQRLDRWFPGAEANRSGECAGCLFSQAQAKIIWEEGTSIQKTNPSNWAVGKSACFSWSMIDVGWLSSL